MKLNIKKSSMIVPIILVLLINLAGIFWAVQDGNKEMTIPFSSVEKVIASENGEMVTLKEYIDGKLLIKTHEGEFISHVPPNSQMIAKLVENYNIQYTFSSSSPYTPWILGGIVVLLAGIAFYFYKSGKGGLGATTTMKQSVSKARPLPSISLADVGGIQGEMKEEILQTLSIIKEPERSIKLGVKPPKGILLYGPPGTGKTLLAQAIAKELGSTFFSTSGSAFNELFVGVGASRVRNLFQNARKQLPAVIFIDEVDALAGKRKQHGGEESEKTLTELLVQLDGGHSNDGILFIAATNRKDMLDEAFLRPGRIDFSFHVPLPDTQGRKEIIQIHSKNRRLAENVMTSFEELAESTSGFSGAELHSLFETASRRAVQNGQEVIAKEDMDFALDRTILGSTTRSLQDPETKRRVAIHESGHALVAAVTKPGSVRKATIIPRGEALGYVAPIPKELHLSTTSDLLDQVAMILAGGVAERLILGEHSIGVSGDVKQAKHIIEQMVDTGLLEDGFTLTFNKGQKETKMQGLFQKALEKTEMLITANRVQFDLLVAALLKKETLEGAEVQEIVNSPRLAEEKDVVMP
ncbi:ATP-dependent metallopeptidase FtsH/Yme1/Tma family protein [Bacillus sp. FJAT-29790]|uniref:AAA family ATPase n=1 Tax=Bacillus sp. FJAT-29790 TaxID=1895002 RepID=UPI001C24D772|nr:AAA family ATPase [Bacillus sp. FJAT-29790]MBU8878611.1 ATP-dependent metallopeptidase FtsH/Yme1/Tma family protein [Bacillus sp. FJAT-29790]